MLSHMLYHRQISQKNKCFSKMPYIRRANCFEQLSFSQQNSPCSHSSYLPPLSWPCSLVARFVQTTIIAMILINMILIENLSQAQNPAQSQAYCNDDSGLSKADISYLTSNTLTNPDKDVMGWTSCYYQQLNILDRQNDLSERLCKYAFLKHYPLKVFNGMSQINSCNAQVANVTPFDQMTWNFHVCMVNAGFKL